MNNIEVSHLYKFYPDFSLQDVSFALPAGCIMGLIGENGAGKTTTLKMLLNIVKPDQGEVRLFDLPMVPAYERQLKEQANRSEKCLLAVGFRPLSRAFGSVFHFSCPNVE